MGDSKLYSTQDIEKLKQKIATYRDTLTKLKTGNSFDDYLFLKSEFDSFKSQVSNLKRAMELMDGKQSTQVGEHEQQIKKNSLQIDSLNQTVEELNQEISLLMNKLKSDDSNHLIEEIDGSIDLQDSLNPASQNEESEVDHIIEETTHVKDQTSLASIQKANLPPSFKQLQRFVGKATNIQEVPGSRIPTENIDIQKKYQEEQQHFNKQSFPSNSINPNQIYNGLFRNVNKLPTINTSKMARKETISIKINENHLKSFILTDSAPETNETLTEHVDNVHDAAPIEKQLAIIKEEKETIEISNEAEQQESSSKETLSFLKFFRRRN